MKWYDHEIFPTCIKYIYIKSKENVARKKLLTGSFWWSPNRSPILGRVEHSEWRFVGVRLTQLAISDRCIMVFFLSLLLPRQYSYENKHQEHMLHKWEYILHTVCIIGSLHIPESACKWKNTLWIKINNKARQLQLSYKLSSINHESPIIHHDRPWISWYTMYPWQTFIVTRVFQLVFGPLP